MIRRIYDVNGISPTVDACGGGGTQIKVLVSDNEMAKILRYERTEYGKRIRKQYESGEIKEQRKNMRVLVPRPDDVSNTLTTVLKDNLLFDDLGENGLKTVTVNDLFCGAGGMGLGFKNAGFEIAGAWDFDKFAVRSYAHNIGDHVKQSDISQMIWSDLPKSDVWTFGFPCQDLSIAGKQAGLFEGKRSGLFFEVMRLLDETTENKPENLPTVIMAENVKGLKPYLDVLREEYTARGYKLYLTNQNGGVFNSKFWGVPQNRERYFVVGIHNSVNAPFIFPEQQEYYIPKLSSILEPIVDEKYYVDPGKTKTIIEQAKAKTDLQNTHACITPDRVDKRQNGRRAKEEEEESFTLTAQDRHGVILKDNLHKCIDDQGRTKKELKFHDISPTLKAQEHGNNKKVVVQVKEATKKGFAEASIGDSINIAHPNSKTRRGRVGKQVAQTLIASQCEQVVVNDDFRIRKLTPREYARLQGFPDSYEIVVSDSQAYKQFGNAVTVNVAQAIAERIRMFLLSL